MVALSTWADLAVGSCLLGCAVVVSRPRRGRRTALLLAATGGTWLLGGLYPGAVLVHRGPWAHLLLGYPTGRLTGWAGAAVTLVVYLTAVAGSGPEATAGVALGVGLASVVTYRAKTGPSRRGGLPALLGSLAFAAVLAVGSLNALLNWRADHAVLVAYDVVMCGVAVGLTLDLVHGHWSEAAVADLVTRLGSDPASMTDALRRGVGDPLLRIGFRVDDAGSLVDESGDPVELEPGSRQTVTPVLNARGKGAVLAHDPGLVEDRSLFEGTVAAVRLAVDAARLRLVVGEQTEALAAARRRMIEAAETQRAALAAEIAAGPGRELAAARHALLPVATSSPALAAVVAEIENAEADLERLCYGLRPRSLAEGGLAGAVAALVARAPYGVDVELCDRRMDPAVESAVFFLCAETLSNAAKYARATAMSVQVVDVGDRVVVYVRDNGVGGASLPGQGLRGLADRIEALGGTLTVTSEKLQGTSVSAVIPIVRAWEGVVR